MLNKTNIDKALQNSVSVKPYEPQAQAQEPAYAPQPQPQAPAYVPPAPAPAYAPQAPAPAYVPRAYAPKTYAPRTYAPKPKSKLEKGYVKLSKTNVIAESKEAVLFEVGELAVGFSKKSLYPSPYSLIIDISIVLEGTYNYTSAKDAYEKTNVQPQLIKGIDLYNYIIKE